MAYEARRPIPNNPGIFWNVTSAPRTEPNPEEGLQAIVDTLQQERYAPILSDQGFELRAPTNAHIDFGKRVRYGLLSQGRPIGSISIGLNRQTSDTSTNEHLSALTYAMFFNLNEGLLRSYQERNEFLPDYLQTIPRDVLAPDAAQIAQDTVNRIAREAMQRPEPEKDDDGQYLFNFPDESDSE